jgi:hypothetical protein
MSASETSRKGTIGEFAVMQHFLRLKYDVFKEVTGSSGIDFIAYKNGKFTRVQVKTSTSKEGLVLFEACKQHNHTLSYNGDEFDVMALYVTDRDVVLFISLTELMQYKRAMCIRFEESGKKFSTSNYARNYLELPSEDCHVSREEKDP